MKLKKDGWIAVIAYCGESRVPEKTSLCKLFWRFIGMLFIVIPIGVIGILLGFVIGFLIGYRPISDEGEILFEPYKRWPSIKKFRILPIYGIIIYGIFVIWPLIQPWLLFFVGAALLFSFLFTVVIGVLMALDWFKENADDSEVYQMIKTFLKNKKQKICPEVWFVEK